MPKRAHLQHVEPEIVTGSTENLTKPAEDLTPPPSIPFKRLILSRKPGQTIELHGGAELGGVTIRVNEIYGNKVRLSVEASPAINVRRGEIPPLPAVDPTPTDPPLCKAG